MLTLLLVSINYGQFVGKFDNVETMGLECLFPLNKIPIKDVLYFSAITTAWQKVMGQSVSGGLFPSNHGLEYNTGSTRYISKTVMNNYK
jgi:hypothetical protein